MYGFVPLHHIYIVYVLKAPPFKGEPEINSCYNIGKGKQCYTSVYIIKGKITYKELMQYNIRQDKIRYDTRN